MAEGPSIEGVGLLGVRDLLGASEELSVQQLAVYLPDKDRNGNSFDNRVWRDEALRSFSKVGGGASAIRDLAGAWLNPETGELILENTALVYTYVLAEKFVQEIGEIRAFLHEFGSATDQGEVMVYFGGVTYRITQFDPPEPSP